VTWKEWTALGRAHIHRQKGELSEAKRIIDVAYAGPSVSAQVRGDVYRAMAGIAAIEGDLKRAVELAEEALEISPSSEGEDLLGALQFAAGQAERALATLTSRGGLPSATRLYRIGQLEEVAATRQTRPYFRKALLLATRRAGNEHGAVNLGEARCCCALAVARLGDSARARNEIAYALKLEPERADIAYMVAAAYSLSGDTEQALDWLSTAVERGYHDLWWARVDPDLDPLRDHPRFTEIMSDWDTRIQALR
jgi:tetratricopeptide (TPR) repeat protein